ncbi:MAG TPA: protein kinase [Thermoanaerobaculia bacterium]|nr:protein kinase [Thermoanaerobaculia bacterium]
MSGTSLGRYRIVRPLGAGGMGEVYVAEDGRLGRQVAIKVIRGSRAVTPLARARFEQEARAASALNHPNIVTIHDISEDNDQPFIVMELLEGKSLRDVVSTPLSCEMLLRVATQIADALSSTHERGIVHRDLKPENVFVTNEGTAKILDFGIARIRRAEEDEQNSATEERLTVEGSAVGTIGYMAPEVIAGGSADFRADIFSFGCILYEMATGVRPFPGNTALEVITACLRESPPGVSERRPDLPPSLSLIIETALRKDPAQRYDSTQRLRDELVALAGVSTVAAKTRPGSSLPRCEYPLLGREEELARIQSLFIEEGARLVTLTGPGGSGKTRLAIAIAEHLLSWFGGRVFFVPLASVGEEDLVGAAIAQALGGLDPSRSPLAAAIAGLQAISARTLLVIDNFEQVIDAAPDLAELIAACPSLTILVTSREILHLYAERNVPVPLLAVPEGDSEPSLEEALQSPAVLLFIERARAANPSFELDSGNVAAVVEICRRLDGLPLAIELAAARSRMITPNAMLMRLEQRLKLLTGGARDLPDRQQTLRRTLDWSHELLTPAEQTLFGRLSVFASGFTLEEAEAVADPFGRLDLDIVDGIGSLVDKSLAVRKGEVEGEPRFGYLGIVRDYAGEHLAASGEEHATRRAHAAYFLVLAEEGGQALATGDSPIWLTRLARDHDNLRAALEWATASGEVEWGLRIAVGIFPFWERTEHLSEGRKRLKALLSLPDPGGNELLRARALFALGVLACTQRDHTAAAERAEESLELYRRLEDAGGIAVSCNCLGLTYTELGDLERAAMNLKESLRIWKRLGDDASYARSLINLAMVHRLQHDYEGARAIYSETEALFARVNDRTSVAWTLNYQGDVAREMEKLDEASTLYRAALVSFRNLGDSWGIASSLIDLGNLARIRGQLEEATEVYREALAEFARLGHTRGIARVLEAMALLAVDQNQPERALTLAGAASRLRDILGLAVAEQEQAELARGLTTARDSLDLENARQPYQCGRCMSLGEAIDYARSGG